MGSPQTADPTPAGDVTYIFRNSVGLEGFLKLEAGAAAKMQVETAGFGFRVLSKAGAAILDVSETGVVTPSGGVGVPTLLADPVAGDPRLYILAGVLKFWDGAAAVEIVVAP